MIIVKSADEIAKMRRAGRIVAIVLEKLKTEVRAGIPTRHLDRVAEQEVGRLGGKSSFKHYRGFPASVCVSVNEEIVHGIPGDRVIQDGDIVSVDYGASIDGYQGDSAFTVAVGHVAAPVKKLIETTQGALEAGIAAARGGCRVGDISAAIQGYAESHGFTVVREYTGHGIGRDMHEDPYVPNFGAAGQGDRLRPGVCLALEPMVTTGTWRTRLSPNQWTVVTADGSLAAHFEHTIALTDNGSEILTTP